VAESAAPQPVTAALAAGARSDAESPVSSHIGAWPSNDEALPATDAGGAGTEPTAADALSPAVRRLVRQYDLDITGIHGTGPAGKIRVGDIIGMLDSRPEPRAQTSEAPSDSMVATVAAAGRRAASGAPRDGRDVSTEATTQTSTPDPTTTGAAPFLPTTTVFECDLSRVLSHRKRERRNEGEISLTSYFLAALDTALLAVPEVVSVALGANAPLRFDDNGVHAPVRLGVLLGAADGGVRRTLVTTTGAELAERLRAIDLQLRASGDDDLGAAGILIHHYGPSGSLLATPTEMGAGHIASVGIGRVRRAIVVRTVDGEDVPRVAALCNVTLTFAPRRLALERANRFVAELVRALELWPIENAA
jgi:2-oxoglutarate dehydrogenase E2 component (dihydrolipoamide succinyltransferase)